MPRTVKEKTSSNLLEELSRLGPILEMMPIGVCITDHNGLVLENNAMMIKMWSGRTPLVDLANKKEHKAWWPGTQQRLGADDWALARALRGESVLNQEMDFERYDGTMGTMLASAAPLKDAEGVIMGAVSTATDITETKLVVSSIERELRRSNSELQQFAYVASHDLQEPLRMVVNSLTLLEKRYKDELDARGKTYISIAVDGGGRMRRLIDDLLAYSRVDARSDPFTMVDMNLVVDQTIRTYEEQIEEISAEIRVKKLAEVLGDESQMLQVMQNLVGNSLKFHGLDKPVINISSTEKENENVFMVQDNGIGLNMVYSERIFQMFNRLHSNYEYPGTGVGLAIAKKIVERHGGRIWVESEKGKGATFYFSSPRVA
jgi:PAS domain S-box-containing protein